MSASKFDPIFFKSLPFYFQSKDFNTYLERFLSIFTEELESVEYSAMGLTDLTDPGLVPSQFLSLMGYFYGMPPSITNDSQYRDLIKLAIPIYKLRGTVAGITKFFKVLGADVYITTKYNTTPKYDDEGTAYDTEDLQYDQGCSYCTKYDMTVVDYLGVLTELGELEPDPLFWANFIQTLSFLMPIGASLDTLYYGASSVEEMNSYRELTISPGGYMEDESITYRILQTIPAIIS